MLLGGKGANLCEMTQIGLNVPPGFTITTDACLAYLEHDELPKGAWEEILKNMKDLEKKTGKQFGGADNPLLVSVRSGSSMSMPGMMDTILNLGLNKTTLQGLIKLTDNPRFGYDAYRRFIQLYGKIALGVEDKHFDDAMAAMKKKVGVSQDVDLKAEHLAELADQFRRSSRPTPASPSRKIPTSSSKSRSRRYSAPGTASARSTTASSSGSPKAQANGTAVNICTMVFGNMGNDSGTGVGFTRNPGTGENLIYGEYLVNAQGEDVVAGIRTPKAIAEMESDMPEIYRQLAGTAQPPRIHYKEVQDFEFTIERGTLYCLQTRNGKMNARRWCAPRSRCSRKA
jgi:pyruvate,orthophosphate dikinase